MMRIPPLTLIALALASIATLAALEGWRRATLTGLQVAALREEIRDFGGALQALLQDLDEVREAIRRAEGEP